MFSWSESNWFSRLENKTWAVLQLRKFVTVCDNLRPFAKIHDNLRQSASIRDRLRQFSEFIPGSSPADGRATPTRDELDVPVAPPGDIVPIYEVGSHGTRSHGRRVSTADVVAPPVARSRSPYSDISDSSLNSAHFHDDSAHLQEDSAHLQEDSAQNDASDDSDSEAQQRARWARSTLLLNTNFTTEVRLKLFLPQKNFLHNKIVPS